MDRIVLAVNFSRQAYDQINIALSVVPLHYAAVYKWPYFSRRNPTAKLNIYGRYRRWGGIGNESRDNAFPAILLVRGVPPAGETKRAFPFRGVVEKPATVRKPSDTYAFKNIAPLYVKRLNRIILIKQRGVYILSCFE